MSAPDRDELVHTLERIRSALDACALRGLAVCGDDELDRLERLAEEASGWGAEHLAERLVAVAATARAGERGAAVTLLRAQAALRLVERVLTLRIAEELLMLHDGYGEPAQGSEPA